MILPESPRLRTLISFMIPIVSPFATAGLINPAALCAAIFACTAS